MRLALYRKYRSADFSQLVGQSHVVTTLQNSVANGQISHAYLFSGPRGTGKTSIARILARNINKLKSTDDISDHIDIVEIDAASNRGIDEMRSLREKVNAAPMQLAYKVYIIDEAHMLTREAFNALLKTLEEPPSHVVFMLATTEANKLPQTIISRTQRYDLKPLSDSQIAKHLQTIADAEDIEYDKEALEAIAVLSEGGMRDGISMLDQLSSSAQKITEELVQTHMGLSTSSQLSELATHTKQHQAEEAIDVLTQILSVGVDAKVLTLQLEKHLRTSLLSELSSGDKNTIAFYVKSLEYLANAKAQFSYSMHSSLPLEIAIIKMSYISSPPHPQPTSSEPEKTDTKNTPKDQTTSNVVKKSQPAPSTKDLQTQCMKGLSVIKQHNNSLYALLRSGEARIENQELVVDAKFNFHKSRIEEHHNRQLIEKVMSKVCDTPITLKVLLHTTTKQSQSDIDANSSELVSSAMAILGGELVDE